MDVRLSRLSLAILLSLIASSTALICPDGSKPLPPDACVQVVGTPGPQSSVCDGTEDSDGPVQLADTNQFDLLQLYAGVVGSGGQMYWMGYRFASADDLGDVPSEVEAELLVDDNYGDGGATVVPGTCLAMGQDGLLYRIDCSTELPAFCYQVFQAPTAVLSLRDGADRFVTLTAGIEFQCDASPGSEVTWRASTGDSVEPVVIPEPDIGSFSVSNAGTYYCIASNPLGAFVSNAINLVPAHDNVDRDETEPEVNMTSDPAEVEFGSQLTLTCTYTSDMQVSNVQWFVNGAPVNETSSMRQASTTLVLQDAQEEGFYQCFIRTESGNIASESMLIALQTGLPGEVDDVSALPSNRTSIIVSWLCPQYPNTQDLSLLRYTIFYQPGFTVDMGRAESVGDLTPTRLDGAEPGGCLAEAIIPGLTMGTTYAVMVVAVSPDGMRGDVADARAVTTTFGDAPGMVENLKVRRTPDNKTVFASWDELKTSLPVGVVSRYKIEYRDIEKDSASTVVHSAKFNYLVVSNVINANSYQVRVSAGVVIQRNPVAFEFGEPTEWEKITGIITMIPPVPPTVQLRTEPAADVIAAAVSVGVLCFIAIATILITGLICLVYKKRKESPSGDDSVKFSTIKTGSYDVTPKH